MSVSLLVGNATLSQESLIDFPHELDNFQIHAINAIEKNEDLLVSVPTGRGKTLVAEYEIVYTIKKMKKKAVYTTPIKSLSNEKFSDFTKLFAKYGISVGILTGDKKINPNADCIIATAEIIRNSMLRTTSHTTDYELDENFIASVGCIIMDEIHYMSDTKRGHVWEYTLSMLPSSVQVVMLSGTIKNSHEICTWLSTIRNKNISLVIEINRIVPLLHYIYIDKKIFQYYNNKLYDAHNVSNAIKYYKEKKMAREKMHKQFDPKKELVDLTIYMKNNNLFPALVFSFAQVKCEEYAHMIKQIDLVSNDEKEQIDRLFQKYIGSNKIKYQYIAQVNEVYALLLYGIGFHHANLLQNLRELCEILMKMKLLKILFTTETLSMGINVPVKTVVFTEVSKYTSDTHRFITPSEYHQMSGRAGRRGLDTQGVIIYCPLKDMPFEEEFKSIVNGENQNICSNFRLDYQTILKLVQKNVNIKDLFNKSLMNYENLIQKNLLLKERDEILSMMNFQNNEFMKNDIQLNEMQFSCIRELQNIELKIDMGLTLTKTQETVKKRLHTIISQNKDISAMYTHTKKQEKMQKQLYQIDQKIKLYTDDIQDKYKGFISVLIQLNYVIYPENDFLQKQNITIRGLICSQINECNPILLTEIISRKYFTELSVPEIVALISVFTEPISKTNPYSLFDFEGTPKLHTYISELAKLITSCEEIEKTAIPELWRTDYLICSDFIDISYEWASGKTVHEMLNYFMDNDVIVVQTELFCKNMNKISNIITIIIGIYQMINQDIEVIPKLEEANKAILRDIVCVNSLYLM